jgi:acyl-CoA thioester hydrolase
MSNEIKFPLELGLRLDWSEMDMFGHINNVMFFKYVQASRVNYWYNVKLMRDYEQKKIGPLLASTSCQFRKPLYFPGDITIQARIDFIKNSSMGIQHRILNDKKEIAAEANDVIVLFDFGKNEKVTIPEELRRTIEDLEQRKF